MDCNDKNLESLRGIALVNRERIKHLEEELTEIKILLKEIKETNVKLKTIVGAATFILGGVWLLVTTFKEVIVHWLQK